ncbi:hypothetical protein K431DRAFT_29699 [Polychaeton citri CBS 116435]|uniref:Uncharacterized protein n=1 Tax=Polychaeton citri CBS 116435 TaxID=1314669 RepID=A0A9P4Q089_9PEZI|nr:hypothetical protein K431DRAFT_29699 [Polychaeton citri CBS 116435]
MAFLDPADIFSATERFHQTPATLSIPGPCSPERLDRCGKPVWFHGKTSLTPPVRSACATHSRPPLTFCACLWGHSPWSATSTLILSCGMRDRPGRATNEPNRIAKPANAGQYVWVDTNPYPAAHQSRIVCPSMRTSRGQQRCYGFHAHHRSVRTQWSVARWGPSLATWRHRVLRQSPSS